MTAREYLSQARRLQARLDQLERARATAWERATSTTANGSTPVSGGEMSRKTESYAELAATIDAEYENLRKVKSEILETIGKVRDNTLAALLIGYYINGSSWEQVAVDIHYSYYRTRRDKHNQALAVVQKILDEKMC